MTESGHGPDSPVAHIVMTVGTSVAGEILAGRYRLEEHISDDSNGRQVWRGLDVVLRRPIAVVLRHPGGQAASEMMSAAVAASRITHPHLVDVYDAIDENARAYVVREWVDGASLRELVADGPLDSGRATAVAHAVASAIAAAHATNMAHGNVHPGTVLIADDGRVVLADARADDSATMEQDIRSVGGILYTALTGHWPHAELGPDRLPDGIRDAAGSLASPRQVRGGLPAYLSELSMDLLDPSIAPPSGEALATELGRLDTDNGDEFFGDGGPFGFVTPLRPSEPDVPRRSGRKLAIGVAALLTHLGRRSRDQPAAHRWFEPGRRGVDDPVTRLVREPEHQCHHRRRSDLTLRQPGAHRRSTQRHPRQPDRRRQGRRRRPQHRLADELV